MNIFELPDLIKELAEENRKMCEKDIKNIKFEILVDDIAEWLGKVTLVYNYKMMVSLTVLVFDIDKANIYAKKILFDSMTPNYNDFEEDFVVDKLINMIKIENESVEPGIKELIKIYKKNELRFNFIFWSLFIIAVDENAYNEKLSDISDIAYMLNFTEEMLEDWITALRLILEGKGFKNYLYLSKEANKFFGHR